MYGGLRMKTKEEIKKQIKFRQEQVEKIANIIEKENPQELYHYLKNINTCKFIIAVLKWVLEEE